jgi:glycosyltransferase involved in cell wall biosynthesis
MKIEDPVRILSVGRAVVKKGYEELIAALAMLPDNLHWSFEHIGGGVLLEKIKGQAVKAGVANRITWHGAQPQAVVLEAMQRSDMFVLASRIAPNGDRDGLPNVLLEAHSQGLACIATNVSAIPELVIHNETGLLVKPGDLHELCGALVSLISDPVRRHELGKAAQSRVQMNFSHDRCINRLAGKFGLPVKALEVSGRVVRKA